MTNLTYWEKDFVVLLTYMNKSWKFSGFCILRHFFDRKSKWS